MNIIGIDPSVVCTGIFILDTERPIIIEKDSKEIKSKNKGIDRLLDIEEAIRDLFLIEIELGVIERPVYSPQYGYAIENVELVAILKRLFRVEEIPLFMVSPPTLKKFITSSGKSPKTEILRAAYKKWNLDNVSEHIVESFALAKIGEMILKRKDINYMNKLNKYEKEVLQKIIGGGK